jgi:hypothetical protein
MQLAGWSGIGDGDLTFVRARRPDWLPDGSIFLISWLPFELRCAFRLIMNTIDIYLIACGIGFDCCAIGFLFLEQRRQVLQRKRVQQNLEEIEHHLQKARMGKLVID